MPCSRKTRTGSAVTVFEVPWFPHLLQVLGDQRFKADSHRDTTGLCHQADEFPVGRDIQANLTTPLDAQGF
jgi:hypothetical protein